MPVASRSRLTAAAGLLALAWAGPAAAWLTEGHRLATREAVRAVGERLPEFFSRGETAIADAAIDPDLRRHRALPQLRGRESPEHYLDLELLGGRSLPDERWEFVQMAAWLGDDPEGIRRWKVSEVGLLPYAVVESFQQLALAFAEIRARPGERHLEDKALVYAGLLAHYAQDLCQPLHTTIHHDGRADERGVTSFTGIHRLTDGLFSLVEPPPAIAPAPLEEVLAEVRSQLARSHALVDRVYELEPAIRRAAEGAPVDEAVALFTRERWGVTVGLTSSLFLAAWERSATIELPSWALPGDPPPAQPPR